MKSITFRVTDKTYECLVQLKTYQTWREFWMLCVIRHCQKILARGAGRRGIDAYKKDIYQFQQEINYG